ncbi:MAG: 30S ribosomal protein S6 [Ignavibacteriales bacterium]|nr:30S ribosomal protein S6 [Ignavibacteriales bacterium]
MSQDKHFYETTFIINASLDDPQIETIITHVTETIARNGGEITATNKWGRKRLAYTISKKNNGYYANIEFSAPGSMIPQLERVYQLDENILRFLTIHLDKKALKAKEQAVIAPTFGEPASVEEQINKPLFEDEEAVPIIPKES